MRLLVEIDGQTVPLSECHWVLYQPCGCPTGTMYADYAPTEEAAWKEFFPTKRERDRRQRAGYRFELVARQRWHDDVMPKLGSDYSCPHRIELGGEA